MNPILFDKVEASIEKIFTNLLNNFVISNTLVTKTTIFIFNNTKFSFFVSNLLFLK